MARHEFGGGAADWAFTFSPDGTVAQAAGTVLTFWDALSGGDQYGAAPMPGGVDDGTGLLDGTGTPVATVTTDDNGEIPASLQGPDGVYRLAADASGTGSGPRRWIYASDMGDDLNTLFTDVGPIAAAQLAPYVYYDPDSASYPARPDTESSVVWWVGPVAPTLGGTGGALATDIWLNTTSGIAPGGVTSVTAADASVTVDNTNPAVPGIATGTLDEIATLHPPTGPVPMNSQTLTGLADGVNPQDAATVSQLPATVVLDTTAGDIQPVGAAAGAGTVGKAADAGHVHAGVQLDGTAADIAAVGAAAAAGATGKAADAGHVHAGIQLDGTATDIQPLSTQAAGAVGKAADAGHVHDWAVIPTGIKTAAYTAAPHDLVRVSTSGGAVTITLPNGPADRTLIAVKVVTSGSPCTVAAAGTDVFNVGGGATSYVLNRAETAWFQYIAVNKVWLSLTHSQAIPFPAASKVVKPASPTGTTSTAGVMMGLGSAITYTPTGSGIVAVTLTTAVQITAGSAGAVTVGGRYGTGGAPANAAAITGTTFGPTADPQVRVNTSASGPATPLTVTDRLALTPGTAYWFDLAVTSPASGDTCVPGNIVAVLHELVA